jgi:hypothetical protein
MEPTDLEKLEIAFASGQERIIEMLALAIAIDRDASIRRALGAESSNQVVLSLGERGPFLTLDQHKVVATSMAGVAPATTTAVVDIRQAVATSSEVAAALLPGLHESERDARTLIRAMRADAESFCREGFGQLEIWAPLFAHVSYQQAALLQSIFDLTRRRLLDERDPKFLHWYWESVHLLGHYTVWLRRQNPRGGSRGHLKSALPFVQSKERNALVS